MGQKWEQQPGETDRNFARFKAFVALGRDRSLTGLGPELGISEKHVRTIASKNDWTSRAAAFDEHEANETIDDLAAIRNRLLRLRIDAAEKGLAALVAGIEAVTVSDAREAQAMASTVKTLLEPIVGTKDGEDAAKAAASGGWTYLVQEVGTDPGRIDRLSRAAGVGTRPNGDATRDTDADGGRSE